MSLLTTTAAVSLSSGGGVNSNITFMQTCLRVDPSGFEYVPWIWDIFGECVHDLREQSSFAVGMISLGFWMLALMPQVIANFKNRDASSLSTGYLIQITLGDTASMTAGIMSGQLITQILLSAYFVLMDIVMITQYIIFVIAPKMYTKIVKKKQQQQEEGKGGPPSKELDNAIEKKNENLKQSETTTVVKSSVLVSLLSLLMIVAFFSSMIAFSQDDLISEPKRNNHVEWINPRKSSSNSRRKLLHAVPEGKEYSTSEAYHNVFTFPPTETVPIIGFSLGCFCAILYMGSRIPQIYLNFRRKTCEGLSPIYFAIGIVGNICYNVSIWLYSSDSAYLMTRIPWLVESTINIFLDLFIMWQFVYYDKIRKKKEGDKSAEKKEMVDTPTSSTTTGSNNSSSENCSKDPISNRDLLGIIKNGPTEFLITL